MNGDVTPGALADCLQWLEAAGFEEEFCRLMRGGNRGLRGRGAGG